MAAAVAVTVAVSRHLRGLSRPRVPHPRPAPSGPAVVLVPAPPPIGLTAADLFAGGEVSRADSRVRSPGIFTCARCPAVTSALDAGPEAYHNPAAGWWGTFAASAVIRNQVVIAGPVAGLIGQQRGQHDHQLGRSVAWSQRADLSSSVAEFALPGVTVSSRGWPPDRACSGHALASRRIRSVEVGKLSRTVHRRSCAGSMFRRASKPRMSNSRRPHGREVALGQGRQMPGHVPGSGWSILAEPP